MEKLDALTLQAKLIRKIEEKAGDKKIVPLICDALNINKSSAYNRINGVKMLDLQEFLCLLDAFEVPLEEVVISEKRKGLFKIDTVERQIRSGREHLEQILHNFSHFGQSNDLCLWTCTDELSYFQCMHFRELALFKLFTYASINWQLPYAESLKFDPDTYPEKSVYDQLMLPVMDFYNRIPTIEIWSDGIYDNIIKQIRYFDSTGQIAGSNITQLLKEQLEQLCEHQYEMAKEGYKWAFSKGKKPFGHQGATFDLYHNSMAPVGITLMAESTALNGVFVVFDDPNFMFVGDEHFFQYTKSWMLTLRKKCIKISQEGEGPRRIYFESLKNRMFH